MESAKERMLRYLDDVYAVESGGLSSLDGLSLEAEDPEMKSMVDDHINTTRVQIGRIDARMRALGGQPHAAKQWVNASIGKLSELANAFHDREDKLTQDMIKAYAFEQFEVAMYTALKAFAASVGDHETEQLANSMISDEQLAAERILELIPQLAKGAVVKTDIFDASALP